MSRSIKVIIDGLGNPVIEAQGFEGENCEDATRGLEEALAGSGKVEKVFKDEWYNSETDEEEVHQRW